MLCNRIFRYFFLSLNCQTKCNSSIQLSSLVKNANVMITMCQYTHLTPAEREYILKSLSENKSITTIAVELDRDKSTISRELSRNSGPNGYSAYAAQEKYTNRRRASRPELKLSNPKIHAYVRTNSIIINGLLSKSQNVLNMKTLILR